MATTVSTETERAAIENVVRLYIDGISTGDAAKLQQAFHADAWMFGSLGGQRYDVPIGQMIEMAVAKPLDSDGSYSARITSVEHVGDAATARLDEDGCWGTLSFVDFFALGKIDGRWQIVNKTFAHTGGEPPAA